MNSAQRACEAARHWDEYSEEAKKRRLSTQKNNSIKDIPLDSRKGPTRTLLSRDFNAGENSVEAARKLMLSDPERFERVAAGLEPLPTTKDHDPCVYFIGHKNRPDLPIKIGKTNNVKSRLWDLQCSHYTELIVLFTISGYSKLEEDFHNRFSRQHVRGEWFALSQNDLESLSKEFELIGSAMPSPGIAANLTFQP